MKTKFIGVYYAQKVKIYSLILFFSLLNICARAQSVGKLSGKVLDRRNEPIPYATVSLHRLNDSSVFRGSLTDTKGEFFLNNVAIGDYYVQISSLGYVTTKSTIIQISHDTLISLVPIMMDRQVNELGEVIIKTTKPLIENQIDKMVLNVENSVLAVGNSLMDILQRAPGVVFDKDDNISLRGKSGVEVMIDGKPTYLSEDQLATLLRSTDANNVQSIEIITNPSSKYDAAGSSGIINIRMKKNQNWGTNGNIILSGGYGKYRKLESSFGLNHRQRVFNVFSTYSLSDRGTFSITAHDRHIEGSQLDTYIGVNSYIHTNNRAHNYKAGIDFFLNKNNTLGFFTSGTLSKIDRDLDGLTKIGKIFNGNDSSVVTKSTGPLRSDFGAYNINYRSVMDTSGTELTLNLDYMRSSRVENYDYASRYHSAIKADYRDAQVFRTLSPLIADIYSAKVDFAHALTPSIKIEAGVKNAYISTDNNFLFEQLGVNGIYLNDPSRTNHFKYRENITAGYANVNTKFKSVAIQAGLRFENTHSGGESITLTSTTKRNYLDFFPSLFLKHKLSSSHSVGASYSRRINRPNYASLNPFVYYIDQYSYTKGNPYLKPQYSDSYEANYSFKEKYAISFNYRHTGDMMAAVVFVDPNTKALYETRENIAAQNYFNLNLNIPLTFTKWWESYNNLTIYHNKFETPNLDGLPFAISRSSWQFNSTQTINLGKATVAEINASYFAPTTNGILNVSSYQGIDLGINRTFTDKKLNLKLAVYDVFNSRPKTTSTSALSGVNYTYHLHSTWESRIVRLSLNWRFGNSKVRVSEKTGGSEAERNRL